MQLRMTKGVGLALALAAGCAVLGVTMAPGWYAIAAFSAWWGLVLALPGARAASSALNFDPSEKSLAQSDTVFDPVFKDLDPINAHRSS